MEGKNPLPFCVDTIIGIFIFIFIFIFSYAVSAYGGWGARKPVYWPVSDYQTITIAAANIRVRNRDSHLHRHVLLSKQNVIRKEEKGNYDWENMI